MSPSLMSITDLSEYLGVAPKTIYQWRYKGEGPPGLKVGGQVRYRPTEVEQWLDANRHDNQVPA